MPSNTVAWEMAEKAYPLEVKSAPYLSPLGNEIVIKNGAVAINPVDWSIQALGSALFPWKKYPCILGTDIAGEVVEAGSGVSRFVVGDRVLGHALGLTTNNAQGAFQTYTVLQAHMVSPISSTLTYETAAVIPLGLSTAASGLFQKNYLALQHPLATSSPQSTGKALLIWGGATSVGSSAIHLAIASGYEVITTASPKNFDYVKKLGASQVFDYNSTTVVEELTDAFKGKTLAGAFDSITRFGACEACANVLLKTEGRKFIAACMPPPEQIPDGVSTQFIFGSDLRKNEVGPAINVKFLPKALADGKYLAAPDPLVVGKGLDNIQAALDRAKEGVSASKVVVSL